MVEVKNKRGEVIHRLPDPGQAGWCDLSGLCLIEADLRNKDLCGFRLSESDLSGADLVGANLGATELRDAKLMNANLRTVRFSFTNLYFASLSGADLSYADFSAVDLKGTTLTDTALKGTSFSSVDFTDADLSGAVLDKTRFAFCDNLHKAEGLSYIKHNSPSSIDRHTLRRSIRHLPDVFLSGAGYSAHEIEVLRDLYATSDS